jgi:hypothetical protein
MKHLPILFTFLCMACVSSQKNIAFDPETYAASITAEELKAHLYTYAGDDFMGREAGTEGEEVAINYLKSEYESLGINGGMPEWCLLHAYDPKFISRKPHFRSK